MMSSPPPTPLTKPKWGRMGRIMRRATQISLKRTRLREVSRPGTTASERDGDSVSLKRTTSRKVIPSAVAVFSPPSQPTEASLPTPIAEGEAEALQREIISPSPLAQPPAQETRPASPESIPMEPAAAPNGGRDEQATSPTGYIPPSVIDSSTGAFMGDPEALPQLDVVVDPHAAAPAPTEAATDAPPPVVDSSAGKSAAFTDDFDDFSEPAVIADPFASTPNPVSYPAPVPAETESEPKSVEIPALEPSASCFDKPMAESMKDFEFVDHEEAHVDTTTEFVEAVVDNTVIDTPAFALVPEAGSEAAPEVSSESAAAASSKSAPAPQEAVDPEHGEAASYYRGDLSKPIAEPYQPSAELVRAPLFTQPTVAPAPAPAPTQEPTAAQPTVGAAVMPQYNKLPSYSGRDIWAGAIPHSTSTQQKTHEEGGHDVWATGTIVAAGGAAAVVGGMAYTSRSGQQEEEHTAYTSTMPLPIPAGSSADAGMGPTMGGSLIRASNVRTYWAFHFQPMAFVALLFALSFLQINKV